MLEKLPRVSIDAKISGDMGPEGKYDAKEIPGTGESPQPNLFHRVLINITLYGSVGLNYIPITFLITFQG